jgi:hypothetical protein
MTNGSKRYERQLTVRQTILESRMAIKQAARKAELEYI